MEQYFLQATICWKRNASCLAFNVNQQQVEIDGKYYFPAGPLWKAHATDQLIDRISWICYIIDQKPTSISLESSRDWQRGDYIESYVVSSNSEETLWHWIQAAVHHHCSPQSKERKRHPHIIHICVCSDTGDEVYLIKVLCIFLSIGTDLLMD